MTTLISLKDRYAEVKGRIALAAAKSGRAQSDVLLVAVTKHADPEHVRELVRLGHQDFAESRVQQLIQRAAMVDEYLERLRTSPSVAMEHGPAGGRLPEQIRWHMIGRLQKNKVKKAIELSRLIQSVDSLRLAEEIQAVALRRDDVVDILLQVNCSGEKTKQGVTGPAAIHVAEQIGTMVNVRLRGLMTMAPLTDDAGEVRLAFERCAECFEEIRTEGDVGADFNILSMGMSNDFETAIECGANLVRVGTALFGEGHDHAAGDGDEGEDEE